jgi:hypothetical protein
MFEGAQQQISDKGTHDLHGQGILAVAERALDLEHLLDPLPPVLNGPSFFVQLDHAEGTQIETIGQDPDQLSVRQLVADNRWEDSLFVMVERVITTTPSKIVTIPMILTRGNASPKTK